MTEYVELHARSGFSFLEGASVPEELAGACARFGMPAMALIDRNGVYGSPRFHMAAKKAGIRAHIGSEITCTNGLSYPLLVESREGYRNLCRLVTRMKLRAKKGEGAATLEELAEFSRGLICLTRHPDERLLDIFGRGNVYAELQRHYHREEEAENQAILERSRNLGISVVATNGVALRHASPARASRRADMHPQSCDTGKRRPAARAQLRAARKSARRNGAPLRRSSGGHRAHRGGFRAPPVHACRPGLRISALPRARGPYPDVVPAPSGGRGRTPALPSLSRSRPEADRARAGPHREAEAARLF